MLRIKYVVKDADSTEPLYFNEKTLKWGSLSDATQYKDQNNAINCMWRYELVNSTPILVLINDFELVELKSAKDSFELDN